MSFGNPWGLLALGAIPLILYLHRRQSADRRLVSFVALWRPGASGARQGSHRPTIDPLLLLRLLIVIGVALGLARPGWTVPSPRRHVFVLDASASMGAREDGSQRLQRAVETAANLSRRIPAGDEVLVLRGGKPPTLVHAFSRDRGSLEAAMRAVTPGEASKDLLAALAMARAALDGGSGAVHVFSDFGDPASLRRLAQQAGLAGEALSLHAVGGPADNVGIVRLEAAPLTRSPFDHEVFVEVGNFSDGARETDVSLYLPEGLRERRRVALAPWERKGVIFSAPRALWFEARLEGTRDALPADDRATLMLVASPTKVLYVSRNDRFLTAALRAHPRLQIHEVPVDRFPSERWRSVSADVAVVDGASLPADFPLPALVLGRERPEKGSPSPLVPIAAWQRAHPLLRGLDLSEVLVPAGERLARDGASVLIRSADGPAAWLSIGAGPRRVELAFPIDRSNLGQTPAFPIFVVRVLDWLIGPADPSPLTLRAGEPLHVALAEAANENLMVRRPDGSAVRVAAEKGYLDFRGTELTGRYQVEGPNLRIPFAVNLLDPSESNLGRRAGAMADHAPVGLAGPTERRDIDRWIFAVALQLLSFEVWLLQRRAKGQSR